MSTVGLVILSVVPILAAVTVHELAHGWVAYKMGDPTPKYAGRLTINPIKHLDPVGTVVFLVTRTVGWAKPVPINPLNFRRPKLGIVLVSVAGPASNIVFACICAVLHYFIGKLPATNEMLVKAFYPLYLMAEIGVVVNIGLAVFNLIPIPPLDGSKILYGILPDEAVRRIMSFEAYGFIVLILFILTGAVDRTIVPIIYRLVNLLM